MTSRVFGRVGYRTHIHLCPSFIGLQVYGPISTNQQHFRTNNCPFLETTLLCYVFRNVMVFVPEITRITTHTGAKVWPSEDTWSSLHARTGRYEALLVPFHLYIRVLRYNYQFTSIICNSRLRQKHARTCCCCYKLYYHNNWFKFRDITYSNIIIFCGLSSALS